ncbi:glutathione S-transferase family protein [Gallaecimonas sp. GXIMD4217]|uniref:glutathione S-transferase family protein n=1 Tax=Gallaecimonas sp. GXIMD4217 TaxID=3131927 RepID=UPI00311B0C1E
MLKLYGDLKSGNCYKVKQLLLLLNIPHHWIHLDILKGETRTPQFLSINPNGKIPALVLEDGRVLCESNAILCYLAEHSPLLPEQGYSRAKVMEWLFFEQYSHEPNIAVARFIKEYQGLPESRRAEFEAKQAGGHKALAVMEKVLSGNDFITGARFTIADIALFAYTHVADEGGFELAPYPGIQAWINRVLGQPGMKTLAQLIALDAQQTRLTGPRHWQLVMRLQQLFHLTQGQRAPLQLDLDLLDHNTLVLRRWYHPQRGGIEYRLPINRIAQVGLARGDKGFLVQCRTRGEDVQALSYSHNGLERAVAKAPASSLDLAEFQDQKLAIHCAKILKFLAKEAASGVPPQGALPDLWASN